MIKYKVNTVNYTFTLSVGILRLRLQFGAYFRNCGKLKEVVLLTVPPIQ